MATEKPKVAFVTLGCAKNQVDTENMAAKLRGAGFEIVDDATCANAVVVNTCSFIQSATEESLEAIFDVADMPNIASGGVLIVAGCMPARYGSELASELSEATSFVPCSKEDDIVHVVCNALRSAETPGANAPKAKATQAKSQQYVPDTTANQNLSNKNAEVSPQTTTLENQGSNQVYAYVKISDGCDRFCSYCTIPLIRGRYHSFAYSEIYATVKRHVARGVKEIVLIAQDTGRWGQDFKDPLSLAWLLGRLAKEFPSTWFRVMYIQPEGITDALLEVVAGNKNICNYFDIPLQHVVPELLQAMNRHGSAEEFEQLICGIRKKVPGACLRTTLIAGFPGETEEQFEELCTFVEQGFFDYVGVFAYSREEGTRAYNLPNQVPDDEKSERAQQLRDVADAVCAPIVASRIGSVCDVLVEGTEEDGQLYGRTMAQAPEVDGVTYIGAGKPGDIVQVRITDTLLYEMEAEAV